VSLIVCAPYVIKVPQEVSQSTIGIARGEIIIVNQVIRYLRQGVEAFFAFEVTFPVFYYESEVMLGCSGLTGHIARVEI